MALNGSITKQYITDAFGNAFLTLSWVRTGISIDDNSSTIQWTLKLSTTNTFTIPLENRQCTVSINGQSFTENVNITIGANAQKELMTGTVTIPHNPDGTKSFAYGLSITNFILIGKTTASGIGELDAIPRPAKIISATSFTDEENPVIKYYGNAVSSVQACISLTGASDDVPYRDVVLADGGYTFNLSTEERNILRAAVKQSSAIPVRFYVKSVANGVTYWDYTNATFSLVNYLPTLAPVVRATDARTLSLTGKSNGSTLIKGYSTVSFNTGAQGRKGATISHQKIVNGSVILEDYTSNTGTIQNVNSNTFYFTATDSRGIIARDAANFTEAAGTWIPYFKLTNSLTTQPLDAQGRLTFTISGKYFNGSFGAKSNTLEVEYMVTNARRQAVTNPSGSGWIKLGTVTPSVDGNGNYSFTYTITGLNYDEEYELTVNAIDELTPVQSAKTVVSAVPVFDWGKDDFHHHTDVDIELGKGLTTTNSDGIAADLVRITDNDKLEIGKGNYINATGSTEIYGDDVGITAGGSVTANAGSIKLNGALTINGRAFGSNKILWNGGAVGSHMNANQTITLSESIYNQPNGIVLVFSSFETGTGYARNVGWTTHYVPKQLVDLYGGGAQTFLMGINAGFSVMGAKYLYITGTQITGHAGNTSTGANSGITFKNNEFVLRYVIGI